MGANTEFDSIIYCLLVVAQTITLCTLSDDDVIVPYVWIYDA